jgi:hypothetical protein
VTPRIFLVIALLAGCVARPTPPGAPRADALSWRHVALGLCEDYPEETRTLDEVRADLALVAAAGLGVLRVSMGWDDLEPQKDHYVFDFWDQVVRLAEERHIRLIPYVAYTPAWNAEGHFEDFWRRPPRDVGEFGQLMELLARRYRGRIGSWELWNEPDNADYWRGSVAAYQALLRAGAEGVRRGDPAARVVSGGLAGKVEFLRGVLGDPATARSIDVVNVHAYNETWNGSPLEQLTGYLDEVAALAGSRPLWLAEVGYSNHRRGGEVSPGYHARYGYEHSPSFQADVLVRTLALALAGPHLSLVAWYELKDPRADAPMIGDVNNRHLGVTFADRRPKPSLAALALWARLFGPGFRSLDAQVRVSGDGPAAVLHAFLLTDGTALVVAWLPTNPAGAPPPPPGGDAADSRHSELAITLPCASAREAVRLDGTGRILGSVPITGQRLGPLEVRGGAVSLVSVPRCQPPAPN